jgi:hypothetical protein
MYNLPLALSLILQTKTAELRLQMGDFKAVSVRQNILGLV